MPDSLSSALLTNSEMAEADLLTIAGGTPGSVVMEQAGAAVASEAARLLPRHGRVAVFGGPGNNGGDGFVAARVLAAQEFTGELGLLGARDRLRGDAAFAAKSWTGKILGVEELDLDSADLVIDALFGAGLARDLDGPAKAFVLRLNEWAKRTKKPILSVDVPSGINGSSGQILGAAINAARTITFSRRKPGHLLLPGRIHCGGTVVADIGIGDRVLATISPKTFANCPAVWQQSFPVPRIGGHKYSRGHAVVLSGGPAHTGAARLAARGALRAGAGLVTVATPGASRPCRGAHRDHDPRVRQCRRPHQPPGRSPEEHARHGTRAGRGGKNPGPGAGRAQCRSGIRSGVPRRRARRRCAHQF